MNKHIRTYTEVSFGVQAFLAGAGIGFYHHATNSCIESMDGLVASDLPAVRV